MKTSRPRPDASTRRHALESDLELVEPENPLPPFRMDDLPEPVRRAAARAGWRELLPVQARAIPYLHADRDLLIQSRTGSGKTGAFLLPLLTRIDPARRETQGLILVPTRELAQQVAAEALTLAGDDGVRVAAVYGGVAYGPQLDALTAGAHIVVGTPGRILDHLMRRSMTLENLRTLVFDEADRMLSMGFYPDMKAVQRYMPKRRVHACMFSATFPHRVRTLARQFLARPEFLSLSKDHVAVEHIDHAFCRIQGLDKDRCLVRLIELDNPASALIFCNTKSKVHYVATVLRRFGYDADELSSDLAQKDREAVLRRVHAGGLRFLVATDVAARGIDIADLPYVLQYEPPEDPELYVHRAGRTGRAGAGGTAVTLVSPGVEIVALKQIQKQFNIDITERPTPTDADVEAVVGQRLTALLEAKLRQRDRLEIERMRRFVPLAQSLAEQGGEASILAMLLDDFYHEALHGSSERGEGKAPAPAEAAAPDESAAPAPVDVPASPSTTPAVDHGDAPVADAVPSPSDAPSVGRKPSRKKPSTSTKKTPPPAAEASIDPATALAAVAEKTATSKKPRPSSASSTRKKKADAASTDAPARDASPASSASVRRRRKKDETPE